MDQIDLNLYLDQVYEQTSAYLIRYITIKCRRTEDIGDILQNTYLNFLKIIRKNGAQNIFNPKHYLLRIAKHELARYYEELSADINFSAVSMDSEDFVEKADQTNAGWLEDDFFSATIEFGLDQNHLWEKIKSLGDRTVKVMTLRFVYEMQLDEIAAKLELTTSNVKNILYRALETLRKEDSYERIQ